MKSLIVLSFIVLFSCCNSEKQRNNVFLSSNFKGAIESYIIENPTIPNKCGEFPVYMVFFEKYEETITFWIGAQLGGPDPNPFDESGTEPNVNKKENKGFVILNERLVFIIDYQNSTGYGLYDVTGLSNINDMSFNEIPDSCTHVGYPGLWIYKIGNGSFDLIEKTEPFNLK